MKALALLKQFHNSANKSGLSKTDENTFDRFIFCSWQGGEVISKTVFLKFLQSNTFDDKAGFSKEIAETLFQRYRESLKLLENELNSVQ